VKLESVPTLIMHVRINKVNVKIIQNV